MIQEITLGVVSNRDKNGTLKEVQHFTEIGNYKFKSYHYKVIIDGTNTEVLLHIEGENLLDSNNKKWFFIYANSSK